MTHREKHKKYASLSLGTVLVTGLAFIIVSACTDQQAKAKPNIVQKDAPRPGVVAKIGGEEITEEMLIGDDKMDFFELKKREYDLRMDRLNKLMVEKLIAPEAKAAGMSMDDYISKKVVGGDIKISDKEYKKFVTDRKIPESQLNPEIKERVMNYLQTSKKQELLQAHIAKLTKAQPVERYFAKPKMEVKVEAGNSPSFGPADAPIQVVEFSDFECPFCSRGADVVHQLKAKYGNKMHFTFKQFPLPMHKNAAPAAEAALCVNEQGSDKFFKYHDILFKNQDKLDAANLEKFAKEAGANVDKFKECVTAKKFATAVQQDMQTGEKIGVKSTPTFFVNGQLVSGAVPIEQFAEIIEGN